jgi:K+-sensing histidine kinase KdpD
MTIGGDRLDSQDPTVMLARAMAPARDLESVTRPLLDLLSRTTGLESTYLTVIHWGDLKQEVRFAHNAGAIEIPEGTLIDWSETLCRRTLLEGRALTNDVEAAWGIDHGARDLGLVTYASVPVTTGLDGGIYGTLCAASAVRRDVADDVVQVMKLFARLISEQVMREQAVVSERARALAAEEQARARRMLMASAEHQLKTPLTIVRGAAQTLHDRWDELTEDDKRKLVGAVMRSGDELSTCVDAMLSQSASEATVADLQLRGVWLRPILEATAADFDLVSSSHEITVRCDDGLLAIADPAALSQVLGHLVENAMKYAPAGSAIDVEGNRQGESVVIAVRDRGPGLPDGDVFRAFERGSNAGGTIGSGLGLYVVRTLVASMGGAVEGRDRPDGGAELLVTLRAA